MPEELHIHISLKFLPQSLGLTGLPSPDQSKALCLGVGDSHPLSGLGCGSAAECLACMCGGLDSNPDTTETENAHFPLLCLDTPSVGHVGHLEQQWQ